MSEYDLIISSSSAFAKGIIPGPNAKHLCYLHTPMRYVWDQRFAYETGWLKQPLLRCYFRHVGFKMRQWDLSSAPRVDRLVANSEYVAARAHRYYNRRAEVVPPPVATEFLQQLRPTLGQPTRDFWLVAGALVPYKRVDLAIQSCEDLQQKLIIAGSGPELSRLRRLAGPNTSFVVSPDTTAMHQLMFNARGLIFPGLEDFGMVPIEAMALGTPVLAYAKGGAADYMEDGINGLCFNDQSVSALSSTIQKFKTMQFDSEAISASMSRFSKANFVASIRAHINAVLKDG